MKLKKILILILRIIQGILLFGALVMGVGNMPSGFGACFLLLAIFLTPGKILKWLADYWEQRLIFTVGLVYYFVYSIPMEDAHVAAENFIQFLLRLQDIFLGG